MPSGGQNAYPLDGFQKQTFLEWLVKPPKEREPRQIKDLADQIGVARRTLVNWQHEKEFLEAWEKLYLETVGSPGRKSEIMDTLFKTATDQDDPKHVQAAKTYMEIEGTLKPARTEINVQTGDAASLTMDQLDEAIARKATDEKERRLRAVGDGE